MTPDDARFLTLTAEAAQSVIDEYATAQATFSSEGSELKSPEPSGPAAVAPDEACPHCHDAYERDESGVCGCQKVVTADTLEDARQDERDSRLSFGWLYGNRTRGY